MPRNKACLGYKQAYADQNTKAFQFQNFSLTRSSALVLEGLRYNFKHFVICLVWPLSAELTGRTYDHNMPTDTALLLGSVDKSASSLAAYTPQSSNA